MGHAQAQKSEDPAKKAADSEPEESGPANDVAKPSDTPSLLDAQRKDQSPAAAKEPEQKSAGLKNYEATLGKWLGPKLYKAVSKQITHDKMVKYANSGMKSALKALGKSVGDLADGQLSDSDVDKLVKALQAEYGSVAGDWVKENGEGLTDALNGFVDANPILIVTIGLLAAAGAIAADMDIPAFSTSIGIKSGFSAQIGAELGTLQNLALEKIEAGIKYESKKLDAKWVGIYEGDKGFSTKMNLKYQASKNTSVGMFGQWSEQDGAAGGINLDYKKDDRFSFGAYGKMSEKNGAEVGLGMKWRF